MAEPNVRSRKKLIEVALPLDSINIASVREGFIYRGNPSALHKWWAQRPLAAARAVIFAQMVDDPSTYVDTLLGLPEIKRAGEREIKKRLEIWKKRKAEHDSGTIDAADPGPEPALADCVADIERKRLFRIIEDLVKWESTNDQEVLQEARDEIWQSWRRATADNAGHPSAKELFDRSRLPAFHDPFAGGGTLPLEAQRLGLEARASDLNPVAVLINKAMIEIPAKFNGNSPVNPPARNNKDLVGHAFAGSQGLADDVRYYGNWLFSEAAKRIGHLYPTVQITAEMAKDRPDLESCVGEELTVISWLWARTVKSPNPAFANIDVPLASTFMVSSKPGKEVYVAPAVGNAGYRFALKIGKPTNPAATKRGTKAGTSGSSFLCLMSGTPIPFEYIRKEAKAGGMGARLMAIVAEGKRGRIYLEPTKDMEELATSAKPVDAPDTELPTKALGFRVQEYGMTRWRDLFTSRQLVALTTFSNLMSEMTTLIRADAVASGLSEKDKGLQDGGIGATAYAEAVTIYLALAQDKAAEYGCTIVPWYAKEDRPKGLFARHAIPMVWDYAEVNPLSKIGGSFIASVGIVAGALAGCAAEGPKAVALQLDAVKTALAHRAVVSTDPPYYDNIGYADLSDFFYVWLRRSLKVILPDLFATLTVPKAEELVATPYRHGSSDKAETFFLNGMTRAMNQLAEQAHPGFPVTIYYAYKQSEKDTDKGSSSTGWETFLEAVIQAGFGISGTWPIRTERGARSIGLGTNALASSIVIVCRKRLVEAPTATRREFVATLKAELPRALAHLQRGNIAPVDLAQAAIGPGMAVFTRYSKVVDADGKPVSVRDALTLINATLDEALAEQEGDFDSDSRFALAWFEQNGFAEGEYGVAEVLSKAKVTSIAGMAEAGILESRRGKVRLLRPEELPADWDPAGDTRLNTWEVVHHLVRALAQGEAAAATLVAKLGNRAETARELAYRLYNTSNSKKRAAEALTYNGLVQSFPEIIRLAREIQTTAGPTQAEMTV